MSALPARCMSGAEATVYARQVVESIEHELEPAEAVRFRASIAIDLTVDATILGKRRAKENALRSLWRRLTPQAPAYWRLGDRMPKGPNEADWARLTRIAAILGLEVIR